jgi:hypothetical protein
MGNVDKSPNNRCVVSTDHTKFVTCPRSHSDVFKTITCGACDPNTYHSISSALDSRLAITHRELHHLNSKLQRPTLGFCGLSAES